MTQRFPRTARIRDKAGFDRCFATRLRLHGEHFSLNWSPLEATATARLGLAIGRKVDPRAVGRNRLKRVARDVFRQHPVRLLGVDIVVSARPGARDAVGAALSADLNKLFERVIAALPALAAQGTMRASPEPASAAPAVPAAPIPAPRSTRMQTRTPGRSPTDGRS